LTGSANAYPYNMATPINVSRNGRFDFAANCR
jgi:hypothetical protein